MPDAVPSIFYSDSEYHFFCMEMLENGFLNWKEQLLQRNYTSAYAEAAGRLLAAIHQRSVGDEEAARDFDTLENFRQLRIEPYLLACGSKHPELEPYFIEETERLSGVATCLVHGDFSPKNILVSSERLVVLDCEVAWYGDPLFDVAFLLNHFILKALHLSSDRKQIMYLADCIWDSYQKDAGDIIYSEFETQLVHLLKMLMLARVDGKSPVEYLHEQYRELVRVFIRKALPDGMDTEESQFTKQLTMSGR
ncbi:MAG: phosphotransferase [Gammaproteobacteria bacterium]|nr:phosphotransferase [Gammaproteobacteria bacterium]